MLESKRSDEQFDVKAEHKKMKEMLRVSQEAYQIFMNEAMDSFILFDSKLNFVDINSNSLKYWPAGTRKEDIIGKNIVDLMPDSKKSGRYDKFLEVLATGEPFISTDVILGPKSGKLHFITKAFKVGDGLGHIATDITEHKRVEEKLIKAQEALKKKMDYLEKFEKIAVGRELKMMEMKKKMNAMAKELGRPEPYA